MVTQEEWIVIRHLREKAMSVSTFARDGPPRYGPRAKKPSKLDPFKAYLQGTGGAVHQNRALGRVLSPLQQATIEVHPPTAGPSAPEIGLNTTVFAIKSQSGFIFLSVCDIFKTSEYQ